MTTTQSQRIEQSFTNFRNTAPGRVREPLPTPADPAEPLDGIDPARMQELRDDLLEDWDCPTMTDLGLCRAHALTLKQIRAIAETPGYQDALEDLRAIRDMRREPIRARSIALAVDRLSYVATHDPTSASYAKEIRLAVKQLLAIVTPATEPRDPSRADPATPADATDDPEPRRTTPADAPAAPNPCATGNPPQPHANRIDTQGADPCPASCSCFSCSPRASSPRPRSPSPSVPPPTASSSTASSPTRPNTPTAPSPPRPN